MAAFSTEAKATQARYGTRRSAAQAADWPEGKDRPDDGDQQEPDHDKAEERIARTEEGERPADVEGKLNEKRSQR